jgi:hypothetical protein
MDLGPLTPATHRTCRLLQPSGVALVPVENFENEALDAGSNSETAGVRTCQEADPRHARCGS